MSEPLDMDRIYGSQLDDVFNEYTRTQTTGGFAVGDRVRPRFGAPGNDCYGHVTWVGGCSQRNAPWCMENCCNVEMECMNRTHYHYADTRRTCLPAAELEHID